MREVILDTETTGLDATGGDRIVEIGAVEVLNAIPTGRTFHVYINPERDMPDGAFRVHGLSAEFLSDKPVFTLVADDFLTFLSGDTLIAHNASFDVGFLNAELARCGRPTIAASQVVDTLAIARRKNPGSPASLDALCARYNIDTSRRTLHGALLDAELLAEVYLELSGGRQAAFELASARDHAADAAGQRRQRPKPLAPRLTEADRAAHRAFIATLKDPLWHDIWDDGATKLAAE
ncbi:MAG: DNA polymerase III subunit epsilon [Pseudomonadota bacterium]